jgi:phosphatidylserine decarboxylase
MIIYILLFFVVIVPLAYLFFWKVYFLRNPDRNIPNATDIVLSPADGKIIEIHEYTKSEVALLKGDKRYRGLIKTITEDVSPHGYLVSIFMSPLDVHMNRAPISGTVHSVKHSDGKFLAVNSFESGLVNEKTEIVIKNKKLSVKMIQIAGFLARRVVTHVKPGETVEMGQIVGLINLGSQVTLVLPSSVRLKVSKGDRVVAGETTIAKINS